MMCICLKVTCLEMVVEKGKCPICWVRQADSQSNISHSYNFKYILCLSLSTHTHTHIYAYTERKKKSERTTPKCWLTVSKQQDYKITGDFFPVIYILQYFKNFVQQTCIAFNIRNINFNVLLFMHIPLKWQMSSCQIKNVDTMFGF